MKYNIYHIVFTRPCVAEYLFDGEFDNEMLGERQVVVKTAVSTVSPGTERANLIGEDSVNILGAKSPFPRYLGYSSSGTVVAIGEKVTSLKVGDSVSVFDGYHASYNVVDERNAVKLPLGVSFFHGALGFIMSFPLAAIRKTELEVGEPMLVMGLGLLGQLAVRLARVSGAVPVISADPIASRRALAQKGGADTSLDPKSQDFTEKVKNLTCGGARTCVEVTGLGQGLNQALDCMAKFGRIALLGCTRNSDFNVDYYKKVHGPGIKLIGAHTAARPSLESAPHYWSVRDDIEAALKLISHGRIKVDDLIAEVHSPTECSGVYDRLINDKDFPVCVQFDWSKVKNEEN